MTTEAASNRRQWQVLIVVVTGVFMASLDLFIVNIAFPQIHHEFRTSLGSLSWILNAYAIVFAALLVPAGRWADAFGRKRAFLLGLELFTAASAACAVAPSVGFLTIARGVQALGAALLMPTSLGLMLPEFPPQRRHIAIGVWAAVGGVAAAAGPPLGGLLVQASWRWVFVVNVPVGVIALAVAWRLLREIRDPDATRPDVLGAGVLTAALGALVVAIVKGPDWGWLSLGTVGLFAVAAALLAVTAWRSAHHPAPVVEPAIVRVRAFSLATAGSVLFFMAFAAMLLGSVLYLTTIWREPILTAGLMLAPGPATAALFAVPGARLGKLAGHGAAGAIGALLFACGNVWWLTHVGVDRHYALDWLPGMVIGGAGVGLVLPSLTGAAAATLAPARFATGIALQTTGRQIGSALGVAILVAVLGTGSSPADFRAAWWFMLVAALSAGATLAAVGRVPAPLAAAPAFAEVADVVEATA
jgi:EmrB/QacA subfamily drug resistance transporter